MIRVFDKDINLLAEIDDYESLIFTRNYYTYSKFSIKINANKNNVEKLEINNIIVVDKNVSKCGIIKEISKKNENYEYLEITGYTLDYIFKDRIILPLENSLYNSINSNAETVIKHYINDCVINPLDENRRINLFSLINSSGKGNIKEYNARYDNLSDFISMIRKEQEIGLKLSLNTYTKKIEIDVLVGNNHTSTSEKPVIFSSDYDNLQSQVFYKSEIDYKNFAYIGGKGDGVAKPIVTVGDKKDLERKETFFDTRLEQSKLHEKGITELTKYNKVLTFEGEVINRLPFIYGKDFDLGDIVTITNKKWGVKLDTRIVEITETYEANNNKLSIVFGNNIPTLKDKIDKLIEREVS